jgi:hypothetical protein
MVKQINEFFEDRDYEKMKEKKERRALSWREAIIEAFRRL